MDRNEKFAELNRGRKVIFEFGIDWYIIAYSDSCLLIGTFDQDSISGWPMDYENDDFDGSTFIIPDPVFVKNAWYVKIEEITFK